MREAKPVDERWWARGHRPLQVPTLGSVAPSSGPSYLAANASVFLAPETLLSLCVCVTLFYFHFLAALGLRCCVWAFSSCGERGLL